MKPVEKLTVVDVEKAYGASAPEWAGNCYAVACAIVKAKLVKGTAVYGHWTGPVHPKSVFYDRHCRLGFVNHGWVLLKDDRVLDPTRWEFEQDTPYLYVGDPGDFTFVRCEACGHLEDEHEHGFFRHCTVDGCDCCDYEEGESWPYDEGGNQWRASTATPPPAPEAPWVKLKLKDPVGLEMLLGRKLVKPVKIGRNEAFWIANLPYDAVPKAVYLALITAGQEALIPIDNRRRLGRSGT